MTIPLQFASLLRVHDSRAYGKMDVTRERISRILELREIFLPIQTGFSLVSAAVVRAILESISGLVPSSVLTEPRYLKLVTVSSFCLFTLISVLMPLVTQVRFPGAERDFSPRVNFQYRLSYVCPYTPVCNRMHLHLCAR